MRTVVIMEHDGTGYQAMPIAVIQMESDQHWRVENWLENNGWSQALTIDGEKQWMKMVPGIYGHTRRFAGISEPIDVTEEIN